MQFIPQVTSCQEIFYHMDNLSDFKEILRRFMEVFGGKTQREFAKRFGIPENSVSKAKRKGKIPQGWYDKALRDRNVREAWLRGLDARKFEGAAEEVRQLPEALQRCVRIGKELNEEHQEWLASAAEFFRDADAEDQTYVHQVIHRSLRGAQSRPLERHNPGLRVVPETLARREDHESGGLD